MNKIIKIALIASLIALFGCSAEGNPSGPRIADKSIQNPAGNNPSEGMDKLLKELNGGKSSSHSSKSGPIDSVCDTYVEACSGVYACYDDESFYSCKSSSCSEISESSAMSACGFEY